MKSEFSVSKEDKCQKYSASTTWTCILFQVQRWFCGNNASFWNTLSATLVKLATLFLYILAPKNGLDLQA